MFVSLAACRTPQSALTIAGGSDASTDQRRLLRSVIRLNYTAFPQERRMSGVVIGKDAATVVILTAAHALVGMSGPLTIQPNGADGPSFLIDGDRYPGDFSLSPLWNGHYFPGLTSEALSQDHALIRISGAFPGRDLLHPIKLASRGAAVGDTLTIAGFGADRWSVIGHRRFAKSKVTAIEQSAHHLININQPQVAPGTVKMSCMGLFCFSTPKSIEGALRYSDGGGAALNKRGELVGMLIGPTIDPNVGIIANLHDPVVGKAVAEALAQVGVNFSPSGYSADSQPLRQKNAAVAAEPFAELQENVIYEESRVDGAAAEAVRGDASVIDPDVRSASELAPAANSEQPASTPDEARDFSKEAPAKTPSTGGNRR